MILDLVKAVKAILSAWLHLIVPMEIRLKHLAPSRVHLYHLSNEWRNKMSDKPLAYISIVKSLEPIEGKDRIELAKFGNHAWQVIVQKGQFAPGDKAVYIETGAILPVRDEFKFLESRCFSAKYDGYKIKTIKMGGVYSEGIVFTMDSLEIPQARPVDHNLTKELAIRAIEDEILPVTVIEKTWCRKILSKFFGIEFGRWGFVKGGFPSYLAKTDETQAASIPELFGGMAGTNVYVSIKLDGQSLTFAMHNGIFTICTRNQTIYRNKTQKATRELSPNTASKYKSPSPQAYVAAQLNVPRKLAKLDGIAVQGELCGPKIQKNKIGLADYKFFVFNIFDIAKRRYYSYTEAEKFCIANGFSMVPVVERRKFDFADIGELQEYANMFDYENGSPAEGIVIRGEDDSPYTPEPLEKMHGMMSFKVINQRFKVKYQADE